MGFHEIAANEESGATTCRQKLPPSFSFQKLLHFINSNFLILEPWLVEASLAFVNTFCQSCAFSICQFGGNFCQFSDTFCQSGATFCWHIWTPGMCYVIEYLGKKTGLFLHRKYSPSFQYSVPNEEETTRCGFINFQVAV